MYFLQELEGLEKDDYKDDDKEEDQKAAQVDLRMNKSRINLNQIIYLEHLQNIHLSNNRTNSEF